jgi:Novel STAND NTPase 3
VVLGQTLASFRPTHDAGRDFAFEGEWTPQAGETLAGRFVVQCKFKVKENLYKSDLALEFPKVGRLVEDGRCDSYILVTNAAMTATTEAEIQDELHRVGVRQSLVIGGDSLDRYVRENPQLRAQVPRLYGLGDLTEILDERRYAQAATLLATMREDIAKFVITDPYRRAIGAMTAHGLVLLVGAPAAGKSMVASALAAASIDTWGCRPIRTENAAAFSTGWNPHEPSQFFWIDDAFGATQYQRQQADEWNQLLTQMRAALASGTRIVLTSRDYIWSEAARDLKLSVLPQLQTGRVIVDVHDLSRDDKRQILYNHLKYGNQPKEFRTAVKPYLEAAAEVDPFLPEVARRFGDRQFTKDFEPSRWSVVSFFEHPLEHLEEVVGGLGPDEFAGLAILFMGHGTRTSPIEMGESELSAVERLGSSLAGVLAGLDAMRGSLVVLGSPSDGGGESQWSFKHPTISEAVRRRISARPELLYIYLIGSELSALMVEITCGDVGIEGALVVPNVYFDVVATRLVDAPSGARDEIQIANFLVTRCGRSFLETFAGRMGVLDVDPSRPGSLRVAARLHAMGLLAEDARLRVVETYERRAIQYLDLTILTDRQMRSLVRAGERDRVLGRIRDEVIPDLSSYVNAERDDYDGSEDPDSVVDRLREAFETLLNLFEDDNAVAAAVADVDASLEELSGTLAEEWHGDSDYEPDDWGDRGLGRGADSGFFSDVDE